MPLLTSNTAFPAESRLAKPTDTFLPALAGKIFAWGIMVSVPRSILTPGAYPFGRAGEVPRPEPPPNESSPARALSAARKLV